MRTPIFFFVVVAAMAVIPVVLLSCSTYPMKIGPIDQDNRQLTWAQMSFDQRQEHMRREIVPIAADIFATWRPDRFAEVDCSLCHTRENGVYNYTMPSAGLPRLSGALLLGPEFRTSPETTRLKLDRLVPEVSAALGLKPFSILTQRGFGCYSCHLGPDGPQFGN